MAGVINQNDLLPASMVSLVRHPRGSVRDALGEVKVKAVMKPATTISPDTSIHEGARTMVEHENRMLARHRWRKTRGSRQSHGLVEGTGKEMNLPDDDSYLSRGGKYAGGKPHDQGTCDRGVG